jgi:hypothetical protein
MTQKFGFLELCPVYFLVFPLIDPDLLLDLPLLLRLLELLLLDLELLRPLLELLLELLLVCLWSYFPDSKSISSAKKLGS